MKILLINPAWQGLISKQSKLINRPWPPLDLLNCAALLEQNGISAAVLDCRAKKYSIEAIKSRVEAAALTFITSTPLDRWQCPNPEIDEFVSLVNSVGKKEKVYLTGAQAALYPDELLRQTGVKGVIRGQPEFAVLSVCRNKTGGIVGPIEVDLNRLPVPAYQKINLNDYYYELMGGRFALLETARGCPYRCAFCLKVMYGEKVIRKDVKKVKAEIDFLVKESGARNLYFIDLEFTLERKKVVEIAEYIAQKGYKFNWCCQTRADAVDFELLKLMRRSGCTLIHYGVESGSQRVLDLVEKKIDRDKIRNGLELTRRAGMAAAAFFMFGFPGETEKEMNETIAFAKEINPDYASFHAVIPYPGTMPVEGPTEFIAKIVRQAYLEFYLRPGKILSSLLRPKQLLNQLRLFYNFIK